MVEYNLSPLFDDLFLKIKEEKRLTIVVDGVMSELVKNSIVDLVLSLYEYCSINLIEPYSDVYFKNIDTYNLLKLLYATSESYFAAGMVDKAIDNIHKCKGPVLIIEGIYPYYTNTNIGSLSNRDVYIAIPFSVTSKQLEMVNFASVYTIDSEEFKDCTIQDFFEIFLETFKKLTWFPETKRVSIGNTCSGDAYSDYDDEYENISLNLEINSDKGIESMIYKYSPVKIPVSDDDIMICCFWYSRINAETCSPIDVYNKVRTLTKQYKSSEIVEYVKKQNRCVFKTILKGIKKQNALNDIVDMIINFTSNNKPIMKETRQEDIIASRCIENMGIINELVPLKIDEEYFEDVEDDENSEESLEIFSSFLSLTNWLEELENDGALGLLVDISTTSLGKIGINYGIKINSISNMYVPVEEYLVGVLKFFSDNDYLQFGDLNGQKIFECYGKKYNCIIPMYISDKHWESTKRFIKPILGINLAHNPLAYSPKHNQFFFTMLSHYTCDMMYNSFGKSRIRSFFAYFRTCLQISIENKYTRGIYTLVNNIITNPKKRVFTHLDLYFSLIGQIMTARFTDKTILDNIFYYLVEEIVRQLLKKYKYTKDTLDIFSQGDIAFVENELGAIIDYIRLNDHIDMLYSVISVVDCCEKIYSKIGSYNKFIKLVDEHYSILPEEHIDTIYEFLSNRIKEGSTTANLFNRIGIENFRDKIYLFVLQGMEHLNNKDRYIAIENGTYIDGKIKDLNFQQIYNIYYKKYGKVES